MFFRFHSRHPPKASKVKPVPYSKIPDLIPTKPRLNKDQVRMAVKQFHLKRQKRGRPAGFRKTTAAEDKVILSTFFKVRHPLGRSVESRDVWNALPSALRPKVCFRTVRNRLREKGYAMDEKLTGDDKGVEWRKTRVKFCQRRRKWTEALWTNRLQGAGDFRFFTFFPPYFKRRHAVKSCPRTIMNKKERAKPAFQKPRYHIFKRSEYRRCSKAKVFGVSNERLDGVLCFNFLGRAPREFLFGACRRLREIERHGSVATNLL